MSNVKKNYVIQKRNVLNELRSNNMSLQELRFFSIYLSKISKSDPSTRVVKFPMDDFQAIMELNSRIKIDYMKNVTANLLRQIVSVPDEQGRGYSQFQLFKRCKVYQDDSGEWYVEIDAHDDALPLMFEFKTRYFSYELWNALRLRSSNQLRMYEILKQYEKAGERILSVEDLRNLIGIHKDEYPRYNDFKRFVLDVCREALLEYTDIRFEYEPYGKKGPGGKILKLKFTIMKNQYHTDELTLDAFIEQKKEDVIDVINVTYEDEIYDSPYQERIQYLRDACDGEFTFEQMVVLNNKLLEILSPLEYSSEWNCFHHLKRRYDYMMMQDAKNKIDNRFGYVSSMMDKEL